MTGLLDWWGAAKAPRHACGAHEAVLGLVAQLHARVAKTTSRLGRVQQTGYDRFTQTAVQALRARTPVETAETELLLLYVLRESVADQVAILEQFSRDLEQRAETLAGSANCATDGFVAGRSAAPTTRGFRQLRIGPSETRAA